MLALRLGGLALFMEKAAKATSPKASKTPSGKLRTKSEILDALETMPFDPASLLRSANQLTEALEGRSKVTLRKVSVSAPRATGPEQITSLRKRLNVSQAVLAAYLGVRPTSVMSWEYGRRQPSGAARRLLQIASLHPEILLEVA